MVINRTNKGNLNLDDSWYEMPQHDYADARNISKDSHVSSQDGNANSLIGNTEVIFAGLASTDKVVGPLDDPYRERIIYCVYNPSGFHKILQYKKSTNTISKIFVNKDDSAGEDILKFKADSFIQMNVINRQDGEGDLLFFLNGDGKPCVINIEKTADGSRLPLSYRSMYVHKVPPAYFPGVVYQDDSDRKINNLRNKLFKFRYRFVYQEQEKSVWSAFSNVAIPTYESSDSNPTKNNHIAVSMQTGTKEVRRIELAVSVSVDDNWSDFMFVESFNKDTMDIPDNTYFTFKFYNDGAYSAIDLRESVLLFDWVPDVAGAQDLVNGNVPIYGDITEGVNNTVVPDVKITTDKKEASLTGTTGSLSVTYALRETLPADYDADVAYTFSGTPIPGTVLRFKLLITATSAIDYQTTVTVIEGDTIATVVNRFNTAIQAADVESLVDSRIYPSSNTLLISTHPDTDPYVLIEEASTVSTDNTSIPTFLWSTKRRLGLVYYDEFGRTNGVVTKVNLTDTGIDSNNKDFEVSFDAYSEAVSGKPNIPFIRTEINHRPPSWAKYYHWVINRDLTYSNYLFWCTRDVLTDSDFIYFDISNIHFNGDKNTSVEDVLKYSFAKGDRIRLIKNQVSNVKYDDINYDAEIVGYQVDPKVDGVDKTGHFIKIKKTGSLGALSYTDKKFVIQLYSPFQFGAGANEVYWEFGYRFDVLSAGGELFHGGGISTQTATAPAVTEITRGDAYLRLRKIELEKDSMGFASFYVMDNNFVDIYKSKVNSLSGRALIVDPNQKRTRFPAMVRHGLAYQAGTNINATNRFHPENFDEYDISFGPIKRMKSRDRYLRVFQQSKVGNVPVYQQVIKDAAGGDVLAQSDQLINKVQYFAGNFGIGDCPESLASNNFADYFTDNKRGVICRLSMDGITPLSIIYKTNNWATRYLPLRGNGAKAYGVFDAEFNRYILALEATGSDAARTISFSENNKGFEGFVDLYPEQMVCLNTLLVSFKNGKVWTHNSSVHNNFFGVQYASSITPVFNDSPNVKKNFTNVKMVGSQLWIASDIQTSLGQVSELEDVDYRKKEDGWSAGFLRDSSSPGGLLKGDRLKGNWIAVTLQSSEQGVPSSLFLSTIIFNESHLNNR